MTTTIERTITVESSPEVVFAYVSDVGNLPDYVDQMVAAQRTGSGELHVAADVEGRGHEEGDARFTADAATGRVEWAGGPQSHYAGWMQVEEAGSGSTVHLGLSVSDEDSASSEASVDRTLATLKSRLES